MIYIFILVVCVIAFAIAFVITAGKYEEPADISPEEAIEQLQSIKPYFTYGGRTRAAIDMAIKCIEDCQETN